MGLMKEERGFHCFPRLGHSSGKGREQTPLLAVLQKVAGPQKACPGTPRARILIFSKVPSPVLAGEWQSCFFEMAQTMEP